MGETLQSLPIPTKEGRRQRGRSRRQDTSSASRLSRNLTIDHDTTTVYSNRNKKEPVTAPMAFTAEIPMDMPNYDVYFIYRDTQPGQPFDPTSPPVFFPPKDSDELFDALRAKYPHTKTHSERMRDAIIEFLLNER